MVNATDQLMYILHATSDVIYSFNKRSLASFSKGHFFGTEKCKWKADAYVIIPGRGLIFAFGVFSSLTGECKELAPQCTLLLPISFLPLNGLCSLLIIYKMIAIPHPWLLDSWEICRENQQCQRCASAPSLSLLSSLVGNLLIPKATGSVLCHRFHKASLRAALYVKY